MNWSGMKLVAVVLLCCLCLTACQSPVSNIPREDSRPSDPIADVLSENRVESGTLKQIGFAVQVGAFTRAGNAIRLEQNLKERGVDAYHFLHESGYYKVRFGDHETYATARAEAEQLKKQGVIEHYFIILPDQYPVARRTSEGRDHLRSDLVATAKRFLGVPYRWGGEDRQNGFDCSGLTMVSYRLNGLKLPRNSRAQFKAGKNVARNQLKQGDLVFFATKGGSRVTHVGMYVGSGRFIHAPRTGKTVRIASLSSRFFRKTYVGARTYL